MGGEVSRACCWSALPTGEPSPRRSPPRPGCRLATSASSKAMFIGMDVMIVWNLYRKARKLAEKHGACILFLDEIDAIGASRGGMGGGMGMMGGLMGGSGALNQLLMEMDPPRLNEGWKNACCASGAC